MVNNLKFCMGYNLSIVNKMPTLSFFFTNNCIVIVVKCGKGCIHHDV